MNSNDPRMTGPTLKVLGALLSSGQIELSGADIARVTKLASGTLYPILFRLEDAGWLESRWESDGVKSLKTPRRRFYQITGLGARKIALTLNDFKPIFGSLGWA